MSGFITTMFVPPLSHNRTRPLLPTKPQPLQPIFTFAQSQSCMNVGLQYHTKSPHDTYRELARGGFERVRGGPEYPVKPQLAYKSPLQRIGEALRNSQASSPGCSIVQSPQSQFNSMQDRHDFGQACNGAEDIGLLANRASITHTLLRQHDYPLVSGTNLLSSFYSNPRTRAPFKPQKSSRGTSSWQLKQYAEATLGSGSLRKAVKLPEGEDKDEWLAVNGEKGGIRRSE